MTDNPTTIAAFPREPTQAELRRAAAEWCYTMNRQPDYEWFLSNWRLPGLIPFVEREMGQSL